MRDCQYFSTPVCGVKENKRWGLYLKRPSGDGVRKVIEEELTAELMSNGQGGNIRFCGPFGFNDESFFSSFCS